MKLKKVFLLSAVAATVLSACSDESENFHQDAVKDYLNRLNSYKASFMSVYGDIDPNQCWDFTKQSAAPTTRAIDPTFESYWTKDYVLETIFDEHEAIKQIFDNFREDEDNRSKAVPFVFVVPDEDIVITPQFQGRNGWKNSELHMVVTDDNSSNDYIIWESTVGMQIKKYADSEWTAVPKDAGTTMYGTAGVEDAVNKPVYAVRSKQLVIPRGTFTVGATITLYTKVKAGNDYYYWYSTNIPDSHVGKVYKYGNAIGFVKAESQAENVTYVACEGGSNKDLNDLIFKMEAVTPVPIEEIKWYKEIIASKRYMVEDLGATSASDLDFNDLVFDCVYTCEKEFIVKSEGENTQIIPTGNTRNYESKYTVRACGGTKMIRLGIGYNDCSQFRKDSWKRNILESPAECNTTVVPTLDYTVEYNSGRSTDPFHYNPKSAASKESWMLSRTYTSNTPQTYWENALKNNLIYVKVWPDYESSKDEYDDASFDDNNDYSGDDAKAPYLITFPKNGEVPCIVAFKPSKMWRLEGDAISKENGKYWFKNTSNFFPGEYYAE